MVSTAADKTYLMILNTIAERGKPMNLAEIVINIAQKQNCPLDQIEQLYDELNKSVQKSLEIGLLSITTDGCYMSSEMMAQLSPAQRRNSQPIFQLNDTLRARRTSLKVQARPAAIAVQVTPTQAMSNMRRTTGGLSAAIKAVKRLQGKSSKRRRQPGAKKRAKREQHK